MKINFKTNQWIAIAAIVQIVLLAVSQALRIGHLVVSNAIGLVSLFSIDLINFLLLLYMTSVLSFLQEKTFIKSAFIVWIILGIVGGGIGLMSGELFGYIFWVIYGLLVFAATIYLFIATLSIKNNCITFPYKLFSFGLLTLALLKMLIPIIFPLVTDIRTMRYHGLILQRKMENYADVISLITPIAILILVKNLNQIDQRTGHRK